MPADDDDDGNRYNHPPRDSGKHHAPPSSGAYRTFDNFCGRPTRGALGALLSFTPLSPATRAHVARVYFTLLLMALTTALAVVLQSMALLPHALMMAHGGGGGLLTVLAALACLVALGAVPATPANAARRLLLALLFALLKGLSIGPLLISLSLGSSPGAVVGAAGATVVVFGSFSVAAMRAERRAFMYLGGILGSALSGLALLSLLNMFLGSAMIFSAEIYLGLLVFAGYVMYDTQLMIRDAEQGAADGVAVDEVGPAVNLYVNAIAIFIRLAILFARAASRRPSGHADDDDPHDDGEERGGDFGAARRSRRRAAAARGFRATRV